MPIPAADKRNFRVSDDQAFRLSGGTSLYSLDDLSEAINLIDEEHFRHHVSEGKNDFANWVDHVFGEHELAQELRDHPTPLRMMVAIERFLRKSELGTQPAAEESAPAMPVSSPTPASPMPEMPLEAASPATEVIQPSAPSAPGATQDFSHPLTSFTPAPTPPSTPPQADSDATPTS